MVRTGYLALAALLLGALMLVGCDTSVDPILDAGRPFSVYGYLSPTADTQAVRVYAVGENLETAGSEALDASVTSTHLETGRRRIWKDSLARLSDGSRRHVFWAPFRVEYGGRYRIAVRHPNGDSSWTSVTVPPRSEVQFSAVDSGRASVRTTVTGSAGVPSLIVPRLEYVARTIPPPPPPAGPPGPRIAIAETLEVDLTGAQARTSGGWRFQWDMRDHFFEIRRSMARVDTFTGQSVDLSYIALRSLRISYMVANEEWRPELMGEDVRTLAQPGTFSNVENGFGFVGGGYVVDRSYRPPPDHQNRAGFERCRPPYC